MNILVSVLSIFALLTTPIELVMHQHTSPQNISEHQCTLCQFYHNYTAIAEVDNCLPVNDDTLTEVIGFGNSLVKYFVFIQSFFPRAPPFTTHR